MMQHSKVNESAGNLPLISARSVQTIRQASRLEKSNLQSSTMVPLKGTP